MLRHKARCFDVSRKFYFCETFELQCYPLSTALAVGAHPEGGALRLYRESDERCERFRLSCHPERRAKPVAEVLRMQ